MRISDWSSDVCSSDLLPLVMEGAQSGEEQPAEQGAEHADRQQEGRACGYPARPIARDAPAGHDPVDVGMMGEGGSPGVTNGGAADPGAEMPGIDLKSVVEGKRGAVRVNIGGRRSIKKKK